MTMEFVDIHCHILAGIDDGARDIEESMQMAELARKDGITHIIATPHVRDGVYDNTRKSIERAFINTAWSVHRIIEILPGSEVMITLDILDRVFSGEALTLNGSEYLLLELPFYALPPVLGDFMFNMRMHGVIPVVAHPERYPLLWGNFSAMSSWKDSGALLQITAQSITGGFGRHFRKMSHQMIKKGLADFVATDAHNAKQRAPVLSDSYREVRREFGHAVADRLFIENPHRVLDSRLNKTECKEKVS
jgi:protein-tyrosine phosphatase